MTAAKETTPNMNLETLGHSGSIGTYAIRINHAWWQGTGRDSERLGKELAQFATDKKLSGLIIPKYARYGEVLHDEFSSSNESRAVTLDEVDRSQHRFELYGELGFLTLVAGAAVSRPGNQLGSRVGIVAKLGETPAEDTLTTPEQVSAYEYTGSQVIGRYVSGKYTILNREQPSFGTELGRHGMSMLQTRIGYAPKS